MGCSSGNAMEENRFQKTGNPNRDFFYCFDDQEVKIIEEKGNNYHLVLKKLFNYIVDLKWIIQKKKMKT